MGGFQFDCRPPKLRGVSKFPFSPFREFWELIFRIATSDEPLLVENGHSDGSPTVGRVLSDFRPPQLRGFPISHFAFCAIPKSNFRSTAPNESHLGQKRPLLGAPTVGGFQSSFRPTRLRCVSNFPFSRFIAILKTKFTESPLQTIRTPIENGHS